MPKTGVTLPERYFKGLNQLDDPNDLGPRLGKTLNYTGSAKIWGIIPFMIPDGATGRVWLTAYTSGGDIVLEPLTSPWQTGLFNGPPWPPPGGGIVAPKTGGTTWNQTYDLSATSGTISLDWIVPLGFYSLTTAQVDGASVIASTIGGLTFTYSGSSYGVRGTVTITGTGIMDGRANGEYALVRTHTGNITLSGTVTVIAPGMKYTSALEGYADTTLAALTVIKPLRPTAATMGAATAISDPVNMKAVG